MQRMLAGRVRIAGGSIPSYFPDPLVHHLYSTHGVFRL